MAVVSGFTAGRCSLRPLSFEDERLAALLASSADYFIEHHDGPPGPGALPNLIRDVSPAKRCRDVQLLGIEMGDTLIGLVLLIRDWQIPRQWCLRTLLLTPAWRGRGIGASVYQALCAWAKPQGAATMLIGVLEANTARLRFWQRLGFAEVRRQTFPGYGVALDMVHRFHPVTVGEVVQLGRTLARTWTQESAGLVSLPEQAVPIFGRLGSTG